MFNWHVGPVMRLGQNEKLDSFALVLGNAMKSEAVMTYSDSLSVEPWTGSYTPVNVLCKDIPVVLKPEERYRNLNATISVTTALSPIQL